MYRINRRIYWFILICVSLVCGCSSDGIDNQQNDELLTGTEWGYGRFNGDDYLELEPDTNVTEENYDLVGQYFPNVEFKCTNGEIVCKEESEIAKSVVSEPSAKLIFTPSGVLYYGDSGYTVITTTKFAHYSQIITYVAQSYVSTVNPYISLEVTKDAIMLYYQSVSGHRSEYVYCYLNDFKYTKVWDKILSTDTEREYNDIEEEVFRCQRVDNEVVLANEHRKWIGTLDTDAWTLSFVQIIPNKKDIPLFSLK